MTIILRKVRGISGLTPLMRTNTGSFGAGPAPSSVVAALTSAPTMLIVGLLLVLAFIAAWYIGGHPLPAHSGGILAFPFIGNLAVKLKDVDEKMAAKQQTLHEVFDKAGAEVDFNKPDVLQLVGAKDSKEVVEKVKSMNTELDDLGRERDGIIEMKRIYDTNEARRSQPAKGRELPFSGPDERDARDREKPRKSFGRMIVESKAFLGFKSSRQPMESFEEFNIEAKTLFQTTAGIAPESTRIPGLVIEKATRPIQVLDIIPSAPTSQAAIVYMEETTRTHNAAERTEGNSYGESVFAQTQRSESVRSIGDSVPVTDEQLEDVEGAEAYLDTRLRFGVMQRLDGQIINGDGNAPNLMGILAKPSIQTQAKGNDPAQDAFYKAMVKVRVTGRAVPSHHIINPFDWQGIRLQRTADGIYIWGSPAESGPERMWGLTVVQADSLALGTGISGDFVSFIQLYNRKGLETAIGYVSTQFTQGQKTIRAGVRVALAIYRAAAFCTTTGL